MRPSRFGVRAYLAVFSIADQWLDATAGGLLLLLFLCCCMLRIQRRGRFNVGCLAALRHTQTCLFGTQAIATLKEQSKKKVLASSLAPQLQWPDWGSCEMNVSGAPPMLALWAPTDRVLQRFLQQ